MSAGTRILFHFLIALRMCIIIKMSFFLEDVFEIHYSTTWWAWSSRSGDESIL